MAIGTPTTLGAANTAGVHNAQSFTTGAAIIAGNAVVIGVAIDNNTSTPPTVSNISDGANTYTHALSVKDSSGLREVEYWLTFNALARPISTSITANLSGNNSGAGSLSMTGGLQCSGIATSAATDFTGTNNANTTSPSVTTGVLNNANELILAFQFQDQVTVISSGFTSLVTSSGSGNFFEMDYLVVTSNGSVTVNPTLAAGSAQALLVLSLMAPTPQGGNLSYARRKIIFRR